MTFNDLGLLLVKLSKLRSCVIIDPQQLIQFGVQRQISRRLARWMNSVMTKTARVVTAFHSKVSGLEDSHNTA